MRHFYLYLPTGNLYDLSEHIERQDYYYLGVFKNEATCLEYCNSLLSDVITANEQIYKSLSATNLMGKPLKSIVPKLAEAIRANMQLDFQYRQSLLA